MGEELYELPKGWVWASIGEIANIETGATPLRSKKKYYESGTIPWVTSSALNDLFIKQADEKITELALKETNCKVFPIHTLLIAMYGEGKTRGKVSELLINAATNQACAALIFEDYVLELKPYIKFYLQKNYDDIRCLSSGGVQPNLNLGIIKSTKIPFAPLPEQHRIVAKIEELFTELDAGVELLKKLKAKLKRYRHAVLKAAVEGNLTKEWRKANQGELEPASMLRDHILKQRREKWEAEQLAKMKAQGKTPKDDSWKLKYKEPVAPYTSDLPELPDGWCWVNLEQLSEVVRGASPRPAGDPKFFGGNIPWITVGCLTADTQPYLMSVSDFVTEAGKAASRYIEPETLLLTNSGATLGVPKITKIGGCINDGSVALLHVDYPIKLYLYYLLLSITKQLRAINQGAAQPNLNTGIVKAILVPFPPLMEQKEIIEELERLFSVTNQLEITIDANLKRAEKLRQSILKQAFEGQLVPQDPNDEPAEKLLEWIKAEKTKIEAEKKTKNKSKTKSSQPRKSPTTAIQLELNFNE
ncbi:restriction endonuclease subunit S [Microcoleus sp. S13C4]|uniref:restriction endonuclease subunit S n=1 Tax=Microcoleus sp. S13C4 TaxID=3055410 RepID=UPI002FD3F815